MGSELDPVDSWWDGTREEWHAWRQFKQDKAIALVGAGYSVSWYPDAMNRIEVFIPQRLYTAAPEYRAHIKFFLLPSRYGINGGRVSQLYIEERVQTVEHLLNPAIPLHTGICYNYDRGLDCNRLDEFPDARRLYDIVIETLN